MPGERSDIIGRLLPEQGNAALRSGAYVSPVSRGLTCAGISVEPAVPRAAAGEAHRIAGDLTAPPDAATRDGHDAVSTLHGWQLGGTLGSRIGGGRRLAGR